MFCKWLCRARHNTQNQRPSGLNTDCASFAMNGIPPKDFFGARDCANKRGDQDQEFLIFELLLYGPHTNLILI